MDPLGWLDADDVTTVAFRVQARLQEQVNARTQELGAANAELERQVAERQEAEERLRIANTEMAQIVDAISSILISTDARGIVTLWNPAAVATLGVPAAEAVGRPLIDCPVRWDKAIIERALDGCRVEGRPQRLDDVRFTRANGREGFLGITLNSFGDRDDAGNKVLLLAADITERHMLTSQLAQAQKLESIGRLAAGIAHEINTPIQYVGDNLRFLQDACRKLSDLLGGARQALRSLRAGAAGMDDALACLEAMEGEDTGFMLQEVPMAIADALDGAGRVSEIVRAMREFSHPALTEKTAIDVNRAIQSTITVARNEWKHVAEVHSDLDPNLPLVPCLPAEFNQVILNILINAVHAIADALGDRTGDKGTITVMTRAVDRWAEIRIRDTGTGIPADIRDRVFDPFFTTKEVGRGTGQGLAIAHSVIVEKHGGTITFDTEPGKGTTFVIRLPIECDAVPRGTPQ
jgi:PAS domain S-box-containing protein